ncbi:MAG: diguanylate cyclase [Nitrospiraceae bacterium]|nr:diguanylate cyclase [Nitrospiraceae bacterium]
MARESKIYKTFIYSTSIVIAVILSGMFWFITVRIQELINEEKLAQARTLFNGIVLTRKWNAHYGGVYVEKKKGVESNPYLDNPDIQAANGKSYTNKNPALMTREISEYAEKEGLFKFRITSLKLLNPNNKPDSFETDALFRFERGEIEFYKNEFINNRIHFRYMAPLLIEESCLQCHAKQRYKIGEIRGGISVTFDIEEVQKKLKSNATKMTIFAVLTISLLLTLIYIFTERLMKKILKGQRKIRELATTDDLTTIHNRRHLMTRFAEEFERAKRLKKNLSGIIVDIDNFKSVNDKSGHLVGDKILISVASRIKNSVRIYDILGRYGGDEFFIVLPDAKLEEAMVIAEKIRLKIKEPFHLEKEPAHNLNITVSIGVSSLSSVDKTLDDIIKKADDGLYKAKKLGRDRTETI